jgi:hypothetical protein
LEHGEISKGGGCGYYSVETKHIRIRDTIELAEYLAFIVEAIERVEEVNEEDVPVRKVVEVLVNKVREEDFLVMVQKVDGELRAFVSGFLVVDIYGKLQGVIWMAYGMVGSRGKEGMAWVKRWFKEKGAEELLALSFSRSKAKRRLMQRYGFRLWADTYLMEV